MDNRLQCALTPAMLIVGLACSPEQSLPELEADPVADGAEGPQSPRVATYTRDIAPLIAAHCLTCHADDEIAPFTLENYEDVERLAPVIAQVLAEQPHLVLGEISDRPKPVAPLNPDNVREAAILRDAAIRKTAEAFEPLAPTSTAAEAAQFGTDEQVARAFGLPGKTARQRSRDAVESGASASAGKDAEARNAAHVKAIHDKEKALDRRYQDWLSGKAS